MLMAAAQPAQPAADLCNAELSAAVHGHPNWSLHLLGTTRLNAMYAPSDDVRGFVFPSHNENGPNGWTWFVLQERSGCIRPESAPEPTAEKAARLLEQFVAGLPLSPLHD